MKREPWMTMLSLVGLVYILAPVAYRVAETLGLVR